MWKCIQVFTICYDDVTGYPSCDVIVGVPEVAVGGFPAMQDKKFTF